MCTQTHTHTHKHREVRVPQSNGIMGGGSSPLSRSHELLPQAPFNEAGGVVYAGDILSDEVRSDVNVGGALLPPYRRPSSGSTRSAGGVALPVPSANIHSNSFSAGSRNPSQKSHYRSVSVGNGGVAGGGPVPNQQQQQQQRSPSHSVGPTVGASAGMVGGVPNKTPPQRRANYARHDVLRDASQLLNSQGQ